MGEGEPEGLMITAEQALEKIIGQLDDVIETAEKDISPTKTAMPTKSTEILPGFPERVEGEIVFCDSDVSPFHLDQDREIANHCRTSTPTVFVCLSSSILR